MGLAQDNLIYALFEGLTRVDSTGNVSTAMTESMQVSGDMKTYTFVLKDSQWSNGDPVRAQDFVLSITSQLDPAMKAPRAYMLLPIKGAKERLSGIAVSDDELGLQAIDDKTLKFELEKSTPYFLQLCATPAYFPVHKIANGKIITNGPFMIASKDAEKIVLQKNPVYWGRLPIKLDEIEMRLSSDHNAFRDFEKKQLDWVGAPCMALSDRALQQLNHTSMLQSAPACGVEFIRINTKKSPFTSLRMRKAFMLAINAQKIIDQVMDQDEEAATTFVPKVLGLNNPQTKISYDKERAPEMFAEALREMNTTASELPKITLSFVEQRRTREIAQIIKENIQDALGIELVLQAKTDKEFFTDKASSTYMLTLESWFADYFDATSFLSIFEQTNSSLNTTGWHNNFYNELLEQASEEQDLQQRLELLSQAQEILLKELPVIPIFNFTFTSAKNPTLEGAYLTPMGILELDTAYKLELQLK